MSNAVKKNVPLTPPPPLLCVLPISLPPQSIADDEPRASGEPHGPKNIRRRVYDALNVLYALKIISKEKKDPKKEIRWIGTYHPPCRTRDWRTNPSPGRRCCVCVGGGYRCVCVGGVGF